MQRKSLLRVQRCSWGLALLIATGVCAQTSLTGSVTVVAARTHNTKVANGDVVVWLTPLPVTLGGSALISPTKLQHRAVVLQKNKNFSPHLLVVRVGSEVGFPNRDPFFHNVFSLFEGKRFDLGLYESGSSRSIYFDRPGVSYLFCNIHSEMSAVIIALDTPYYAVSDAGGQIAIAGVPPGRYTLHVWREGGSAAALKSLTRTMVVGSGSTSFGALQVPDNDSLPLTHKNKYGQDYINPEPPGTGYERR